MYVSFRPSCGGLVVLSCRQPRLLAHGFKPSSPSSPARRARSDIAGGRNRLQRRDRVRFSRTSVRLTLVSGKAHAPRHPPGVRVRWQVQQVKMFGGVSFARFMFLFMLSGSQSSPLQPWRGMLRHARGAWGRK
jgi:hypothetical protein